ncbi:MAG TPA: glucosaminidase domain-containing protein [Polyangiaceae bacterium]|nr:glucosaminidase domain-containing protein [Polyangiaceae bacterium]
MAGLPAEANREPSVGSAEIRGTEAARAFEQALERVRDKPSATLVAPVRTKLDTAQASQALRQAWVRVTGEEPSEDTVRVLTAQWAHETGHGASMFNFNFGGIKGTGPSGLSVAQRTREGYGKNEISIVDRFRAYQTPEEGATDYVRLLSSRFPEATDAAKRGDPVAFVHGLKSRGYFTGDPAAYTRSIVSLSGMSLPSGPVEPFPALATRVQAPPLNAQPAAVRTVMPEALPVMPPLPSVDAMALVDEISRAALRIAAQSKPREVG